MTAKNRHLLGASIIALIGVGSLAGCATSAGAPSPSTSGTVQVVASTNVYGDIAKQIGGDRVTVTSIITDPSQDPHSYEADARVQLALSRANIVIENGAGYDAFVDTLLAGAKNPDVTRLTAATISGYDQTPATGSFNEHLWYDFPTMEKVANALVSSLSTLDDGHATTFRANGDTFITALATLESTEASMKKAHAGTGAAITEPVPLYMLDAIGLVNKTPETFSAAIEAGTDVSPAVLNDALTTLRNGTVRLLAYNEQTSSPETEQLKTAAAASGVAVVPVTETLPKGKGYLDWMTLNLAALAKALG